MTRLPSVPPAPARFVILSGCSGGGKSTLLAALAARGHDVIEEPGRRIVREEMAQGGTALPWIDPAAFARRAIAMALADRAEPRPGTGWIVLDRGLIDAAAALEHLTGEPALESVRAERHHPTVFLAPPWPEIHATDAERRHGLDEGIAEYERLIRVYPALGYDVMLLPKASVAERADFVLGVLDHRTGIVIP